MSLPSRTTAAIHATAKQLGMDEDTRRDFMERVTGKRSTLDMDEADARKLMIAFDQEKPNETFPRGNVRPNVRQDRRPIAKKAIALWLMLYNLDAVGNRRDHALDAFAKNVTSKDALRFCTNGEVGKVVEALKGWCLREGVDPDTTAGNILPMQRLVALLWSNLSIAHPATADGFYLRARRVKTLSPSELQQLANELGSHTRRLKLGSRHRKTLSPSQGDQT